MILLMAFWGVGASKEFWFDERFFQVISAQSFSEMVGLLRFENTPPLVYVMSHFWQRVFGSSEAGLRLLTLLPSIFSLIVLRSFVARIFGKIVAAVALLITAVSSTVVIQALELRAYPWLMLWSLLALFFSWSFQQQPKRSTLAVLTVTHILGIYTHYTYLIVLLFLTAWLLANRRSQWRGVLLSFGIVTLAFLPWFSFTEFPKFEYFLTQPEAQKLAVDRWEVLSLPFRMIIAPVDFEGLSWGLFRFLGWVIIAGGLLWTIFLSFFRGLEARERQGLRLFLALFFSGSVLLMPFGIAIPKYATALVPAAIILLAWGLTKLPGPAPIRISCFSAILLISTLVSFQHASLLKGTFRAALSIVSSEQRPGDRLLVYPFSDEILLRPHYHGPLPILGFFPLKKNPGEVTLKDIVQHSFYVSLREENVDQLSVYIGEAPRVWFFYDVTPTRGYWNADLIRTWFQEHGYEEKVYREIFQNTAPLLVRYDRIETQ